MLKNTVKCVIAILPLSLLVFNLFASKKQTEDFFGDGAKINSEDPRLTNLNFYVGYIKIILNK